MARGTARLSGSQVFMLYEEVVKYAKENELMMSNVVVSVVMQSGRVVLTDHDWDAREMRGEHTEDTPKEYVIRGFSASMSF